MQMSRELFEKKKKKKKGKKNKKEEEKKSPSIFQGSNGNH